MLILNSLVQLEKKVGLANTTSQRAQDIGFVFLDMSFLLDKKLQKIAYFLVLEKFRSI